MKVAAFVLAIFIAPSIIAQSSTKKEKPEYPKEVALYKAKDFAAFQLVKDPTDSLTRFEITPL